MGASKAQRAATAARRASAIKLRMAGAEWQQIADQLGYGSKGAACKDVTRALAANVADVHGNVEVYRVQEIERLNRIQLGLWKAATGGSTRAADTVLKVIALRSKYTGVDVPPDVEERIRREMTQRVAAQMSTVWGWVLGELGLTDAQREAWPLLLDQAIARFTTRPRELGPGVIDADEVDDTWDGAA